MRVIYEIDAALNGSPENRVRRREEEKNRPKSSPIHAPSPPLPPTLQPNPDFERSSLFRLKNNYFWLLRS